MEKNTVEILIITGSLVLQQGLYALLESLPSITNVKAMKDLTVAYAWVESRQPEIVLLDADLSRIDSREVLEKLRVRSPGTQWILLVDDVQDVKLIPQYAEAVLIKGASASAVTTIITNLLSGKGAENEGNHSNR